MGMDFFLILLTKDTFKLTRYMRTENITTSRVASDLAMAALHFRIRTTHRKSPI